MVGCGVFGNVTACATSMMGIHAAGPTSAVEPFQFKLKEIVKMEDLHLSQLYNADETGVFWHSLPLTTKTEYCTLKRKINKYKEFVIQEQHQRK